MGREQIVTPGHVFPLVAREGGTLVRAGHTEASVDLARLAGLNPAGVICEIMNDDGTMARMPDLVAFAQHHGLKLGTIADLIAHRRRTERLVRRVSEGHIDHPVSGDWRLVVYTNTLEYAEHLALVKGDVSAPGPVHVRMHAANLLHDIVLGTGTGDLHDAMQMIDTAGRGVVVIIRDWRPTNMSEQVKRNTDRRVTPPEIRDYGIGAQILADLGVHDMVRLSNNPRPIVGLEGYGLRVVETRALIRKDSK
jgi:3,4-dihydroxy 2-butanone 4-phosphate synthase/GTP cyclohydrolase II